MDTMDTMNTMNTTGTADKPLRLKINTEFNFISLKLPRAIERDEQLRKIHFMDRDSGEVIVGLRNHSYLRVLTNDNGRDIFVPPQLHDLALAVREVIPTAQFYVEDVEYDHKIGQTVVNELNVYRTGDVLCMGRIAYGHTGIFSGRRVAWDKDRVNQYLVYSPYIENNKYKDTSDAHFMRASKGLSTAIKTIKKSLRPLSPVVVAYAYKEDIQHKIAKKVNELSYQANRAAYVMDKHTRDMVQLIRDLVDKKVDRITNTALEADMAKYMQALKEHEVAASKPHRFTFVLVRHDDTVSTLEFGANKIEDGIQCISTEVSTYYSADEIPAEVQGGVATLSVLENRDFVDGLGMKSNDRVYWIHHED